MVARLGIPIPFPNTLAGRDYEFVSLVNSAEDTEECASQAQRRHLCQSILNSILLLGK